MNDDLTKDGKNQAIQRLDNLNTIIKGRVIATPPRIRIQITVIPSKDFYQIKKYT